MAARIVSDPAVMMGKPVIQGTRVTVEGILERLAAGESEAQVLSALPRRNHDDILATIEFAARFMRADVIYPVDQRAA